MSPGEKALLVIQVIATAAIALTLIVYFFQLLTMRRQLKASETASTGQNILALINFLQDEEVRQARETAIKTLNSKPVDEWTEDEEKAAARVCSTYDVAAIIMRLGMVPMAPFQENWGPSIRNCYETLEPYIREMQKPENSGPDYWNDFGWLYKRVVN